MVGTTILFIYGLISFYTIILLRYCLDSEFDLKTYPDSAQAAFLPRDVSLSRNPTNYGHKFLKRPTTPTPLKLTQPIKYVTRILLRQIKLLSRIKLTGIFGKGLSKNGKAQKLALQHLLEAVSYRETNLNLTNLVVLPCSLVVKKRDDSQIPSHKATVASSGVGYHLLKKKSTTLSLSRGCYFQLPPLL
ncbi:hypothetical protein YC2023_062834 [Brassica napus]